MLIAFLGIIKFCVLISLARALEHSRRPLVFACCYTGTALLLNLMATMSGMGLLIRGGMCLGASYLYFWLLHRFSSGSVLYFLIMLIGAFLLALL